MPASILQYLIITFAMVISILINIFFLIFQDEPFTFKPTNESDPSTYTGFCIDILNELAKNLNFTYSIYVVEDGEYGRNNNGTWTGMVGDVLYRVMLYSQFFFILLRDCCYSRIAVII